MAKPTVVCFAGNDWWVHNPMTEKQWMRRLAARGWCVLFVNSIGIGMPGRDSPGFTKRIFKKMKSILRWLRKDEGVWVLTPVVLPFWSIPSIRWLNTVLLVMQLRLLLLLLRIERPVFWSGLPTASVLLDKIPSSRVIYYIQDHFLAYYDSMRFTRVPEDHASLLQRADALICASIGMADTLRQSHANVHYIPHGVSDEFLRIPLDGSSPMPEKLRLIAKPIVGYWGSLEALQDRDLIMFLARRHKECSFVFIGDPMFELEPFRQFGNVHFIGPVPHGEIPRYGVHFDVAMLSFVQSDWILYSCPIKYREYLALGRAVVSAKIIEVERAFPGAAIVAHSHEEFSDAIATLLRTHTPERATVLRSLVARQTWDATTDAVEAVITGAGT